LFDLQQTQAGPGFWDNQVLAASVGREITRLQSVLSSFEQAERAVADSAVYWDLVVTEGAAEGSPDWKDLETSINANTSLLEQLEIQTLLDGEHDDQPAIVSIHAGAGGREAFDWAEILYRMYAMWCGSHSYPIEVTDETAGEGGGIQTITFRIEAPFAYGYLKMESGVHRLVRISPFDANHRRHTTFASVDVIPEISTDLDIDIKEDDLRMEVYRASGAGGQHVNKTSSAVRLIHLPTGMVVTCQNERSQHKNREVALKEMKSRLLLLLEKEHKERIEDLRGVQTGISWGNQIRNYVLQPYQLIKDQRSGFETGNTAKLLDGALDEMLLSLLRWSKSVPGNES
jgi:peptide chain release factor 2